MNCKRGKYMISKVEYKDTLVEIGIESIDGLISAITSGMPILSIVKKLKELSNSISNKRLVKKMLLFLVEVESLQIEADEFLNSQLSNENDLQKNGELLFAIIDRADDLRKAKLIGKALKYLLTHKIDNMKNIFFRLCHLINDAYYDDLEILVLFRKDNEQLSTSDEERLEELYRFGFLMDVRFRADNLNESLGKLINSDGFETNGILYVLNKYGILLKDILLSK